MTVEEVKSLACVALQIQMDELEALFGRRNEHTQKYREAYKLLFHATIILEELETKEEEKTFISVTEEELKAIKYLGKIVKHKETGYMLMVNGSHCIDVYAEWYYFYNPETKCWEDWSKEDDS